MPGFPVYHQLPELAQIHVHRVSDAIQPSHPLSSPSPAFNLSQHQGLFQGVSSLYQVATLLEFQYWSIVISTLFLFYLFIYLFFGFPGVSDSKVSAYNARDPGLIPGSGRSPGEQMATHSSILAWEIPWMEEPGRLQSMGSQRVRHD